MYYWIYAAKFQLPILPDHKQKWQQQQNKLTTKTMLLPALFLLSFITISILILFQNPTHMQFCGYAYISRFYVCVYANASSFCLSAGFFMTSQRETETVSLEFKQLHESFKSFAQHVGIFCTYICMRVCTYLCLQGTTIKMFNTLNIK